MSDIHDFWSGQISSLPGIKPVYAGPPPPPCTPIRRNRLTGAYQMPAPVWQEAPPITVAPVVVVEQVKVAEPVVKTVQPSRYSFAEKFNYIEIGGCA